MLNFNLKICDLRSLDAMHKISTGCFIRDPLLLKLLSTIINLKIKHVTCDMFIMLLLQMTYGDLLEILSYIALPRCFRTSNNTLD